MLSYRSLRGNLAKDSDQILKLRSLFFSCTAACVQYICQLAWHCVDKCKSHMVSQKWNYHLFVRFFCFFLVVICYIIPFVHSLFAPPCTNVPLLGISGERRPGHPMQRSLCAFCWKFQNSTEVVVVVACENRPSSLRFSFYCCASNAYTPQL